MLHHLKQMDRRKTFLAFEQLLRRHPTSRGAADKDEVEEKLEEFYRSADG